jgi:hypothetical protein
MKKKKVLDLLQKNKKKTKSKDNKSNKKSSPQYSISKTGLQETTVPKYSKKERQC